MTGAALVVLTTLGLTGQPQMEPPFTAEGLQQPFDLGQPAQLLLTARAPLASVEAELLERSVLWVPWSQGRVLGLVAVAVDDPVGEQPLRLSYRGVDGVRHAIETTVLLQERDYPSDTLRVAPRYTRLSRKDRRRVAAENRLLGELWKQRSDERLWRGSFVRPLDTRPTSVFGERRVFNGKQRSRHLGLDLDGKGGEPVVAANRGRVALAQDLFYAGRAVVLDHGQGLYTLYFHLQRIDAQPGQLVDKGQPLGLVGRSGRVTGPHLHFGVKLEGVYTDPAGVLAMDLADDPLDRAARPGAAP